MAIDVDAAVEGATDAELAVSGGLGDGSDQDVVGSGDGVQEDADKPPAGEPAAQVTALLRPRFGERWAVIFGLLVCTILGGLVGWLGFRCAQSHAAEQRREVFLHAGQQGAVNLTSIDYARVDADIQRVLNSATGTFYDDFKQRSSAFAEVVKKAKSKTSGTIIEAGLESVTADSAQVLVSVSVSTSNMALSDQPPRRWRMRIDVQKVQNEAKISNVVFVP